MRSASKGLKAGRNQIVIVASTALLAVGLTIGLRLMRDQPLPDHAERVAIALVNGDSGTLQRYIGDTERTALGVSGDQVDATLRRLVLPRFKGMKIVGQPVKVVQSAGQQGQYEAEVVNSKGQRHTLMVVIDRVDGQPHTTLAALLNEAWLAEYIAAHPKDEQTPSFGIRSRIAGLRKDRSNLEAIGVKGWLPNPLEPTVEPFGDLERKNVAALQ